jgi:NitT/TauT family transport system substrate-binding protein
LLAAVLGVAAGFVPARAETLDKVSFGTNWVAEGEHGGFFQAVADGTYKKYASTSPSCPAVPTRTTACC